MKPRLILVGCLLAVAGAAWADSLHEATNLEDFGVPDVLADNVRPYDQRLFDAGTRIDGKRCCQRDMYRADGNKVVLLSHDGQYFLAFLINDSGTRMFFAAQKGRFVERPLDEGARWEIPAWLRET